MKIINSQKVPFEKVTYADFDRKILIDTGEVPNLHRLGRAIFKKGQGKADHGHDGRSEIFIIEKGHGVITFNKKDRFEVKEGDVIVTLPDETHLIENPNDEDLTLQYFEIKS